MPMNFTAVPSNPAQPQGPAKVSFTRTSPSLVANTAPIPGADNPVQFRGLAPTPDAAPAQDGATAPQDGAEPRTSPEQSAEESLTAEELAQRKEWWTKRLSVLSRRDKESRRQASEAKAMLAQIEAAKQELATRESRVQEWEKRDGERRRNPRRALEDYGFNAEAALQYMLNDGKLSPEQQLAVSVEERLERERLSREAELQRLRDEQAQRDETQRKEDERAQQIAVQQQEQLAIEEMHAEIRDILEGDPEQYRMLAGTERAPAAVYYRLNQMSDEYLAKNERRPHITTKMIEEAAAYVEQEARAELAAYNKKMGFTEKMAILQPPRPRPPSTLTNRMTPQGGTPPAGERRETEAERRNRVIAQLDAIRAAQRARGGG